MRVVEQFDACFSEDNLKKIFREHVVYSGASGIDNLNQYAFRNQLDEHIQILSRKTLSGTYKFTKYKLKLISKGRGKVPREIAIPTVRDRIALRALCDFLNTRFKRGLDMKLPQSVVSDVKLAIDSSNYDACIKLDVANFYPSIMHSELLMRVRKRVRDEKILGLIKSAITTPTVLASNDNDIPANLGVPQGLAISNILAAIYFTNIDRYLKSREDLAYFRYVDDILILCSSPESNAIATEVIERCGRVGLKIHDPLEAGSKSSIGALPNGFDYLGYEFSQSCITVRISSVEKLRTSITGIFTAYKHSRRKNIDLLLWRLNLRITGCIFDNKQRGWLFFFSEINDETLLHSLDSFVRKMSIRFNVDIKPKRFSRAFKEICHNRYETNYIPDFDKYTSEEMEHVLYRYFNMKTSKMEQEEIEFEFHKRIGKQVKDLLEDMKDFKY